jgi:hypothetical protein
MGVLVETAPEIFIGVEHEIFSRFLHKLSERDLSRVRWPIPKENQRSLNYGTFAGEVHH